MKKEKRVLTRKEYDTIYNAVHNVLDYAREEDITVSEINFIVGYTGLDLQVVLDYMFCDYEIEK